MKMCDKTKADLLFIATKIRKCMELVSERGLIRDYGYRDFPYGWCGLTSCVLGTYLTYNLKCNPCLYVCGVIGDQTHAWIEYKGIIIDITADQFDEIDETVIVEKKHSFYKKFKVDFQRECKIEDISYRPENILYNFICKNIQEDF